MKKPYLIDVSIFDGEHEHDSHAIYWANSEKATIKWAEAQCWNEKEWVDPKDGYWSYGDGTTRTKFRGIQEITLKEAKMLTSLGVVYSVNYPKGLLPKEIK